MDLNLLLLRLLQNIRYYLGSLLIKQTLPNLDTLLHLEEGESHTTSNNHLINSIKQVVNELDLILYLSTSKNHEEWFLGMLQCLSKVVQLLLHKVTSSSYWQVDSRNG
jgi:hypothetical protein